MFGLKLLEMVINLLPWWLAAYVDGALCVTFLLTAYGLYHWGRAAQ